MPGSGSPRFSLSSPRAAEDAREVALGVEDDLRRRTRRRLNPLVERGDRPVGSGPPPPPSTARRLVEWVAIIGVALVVAFLVKTFVLEAFYIPSGSMEPTLMIGDRILVDKLSYDFHPVHRGDVVVFKNPLRNDGDIKDLVKRVIGLPGERISSNAEGQVLINGAVLAEPWLPAGVDPGPPITPQTIKPGYMFVMGDNRGASEDSRAFGQVPESSIVGRVILRVWPLSRFHFF